MQDLNFCSLFFNSLDVMSLKPFPIYIQYEWYVEGKFSLDIQF